MKPFAYARAGSTAEAVRLLREHPDAVALAGGQSLLAAMKLGFASPALLVDLAAIVDLHRMHVATDAIWIGAMCTHAAVAASPQIRVTAPLLSQLAEGIGDRQIRNRGTIGGSVASNDPAACWPAAVLACGAEIHTDRRVIGADDFFKGLYATALAADELIVGLRFPAVAASRGAYRKHEHPASRFALVGVAIVAQPEPDGPVRVALTGLGNGVIRARAHETALMRDFSVGTLHALRLEETLARSDLHASASYRAHLARVMIRRLVAELVAELAAEPGVRGPSRSFCEPQGDRDG